MTRVIISEMKKIIYILGLAIILLGVLGLWFFGNTETNLPTNKLQTQNESMQVFIAGQELEVNKNTHVLSSTLKPKISVYGKGLVESEELKLDTIDLLQEDFFIDASDVVRKKNEISYTPSFLLQPGQHSINISYQKKQLLFPFTLGLLIDFNKLSDIDDSELLVIPSTTRSKYPDAWRIHSQKLEINSINAGSHASIAFIYPLDEPSVSFEFAPKGSVVNLAFYFLENNRTFVLGNGDNSRITLLRGGESSIEGTRTELIPGETYSVRLSKEGSQYLLYISKGILSEVDFKKEQPVLKFSETDIVQKKKDYVGFSVWSGSSGVTIDNLTIFPSPI